MKINVNDFWFEFRFYGEMCLISNINDTNREITLGGGYVKVVGLDTLMFLSF